MNFKNNILQHSHRRKVRTDLTFSFENNLYTAPERYIGKYIIVQKNRAGELIGKGEDDELPFKITKIPGHLP